MFDTMFADAADEALVGIIGQAAQQEAQAAARRLAAIAELVYRTVDYDDERCRWRFDPWSNTAAQVGAAQNIGQRRASGQMHIAVALRERLPKVAELYLHGRISARLISEISWRTSLVEDSQLMALIDDAIAEKAQTWGPLSDARLVGVIDAIIERYDPAAIRRAQELLQNRDFRVGALGDGAETATVSGRLGAAEAAVLQKRITAMATSVCEADPRTIGQRRADALGALGNGVLHLPCRCGLPDCPMAGEPAASNIVVRVIADQAAIAAARQLIAEEDRTTAEKRAASTKTASAEPVAPTEQSPPEKQTAEPRDRHAQTTTDADHSPRDAAPDATSARSADAAEDPQSPAPLKDTGLALLPGAKILPAAGLADAIRTGARILPLRLPGPDCEPAYRPSAMLAEYVRIRDMFCRFPGCDVPADRCDIDHSVPWPYGPTHPSNLNCKCRGHHLMKTFWDGPDGWHETQLPDGTLIWTSPSGQTYTTRPGSRLFFPTLNTTTANLPPPPPTPPPDPLRVARMPTRRRPRNADEAARIKAERALNNSHLTAKSSTPPPPETGPPAQDWPDRPPPF